MSVTRRDTATAAGRGGPRGGRDSAANDGRRFGRGAQCGRHASPTFI